LAALGLEIGDLKLVKVNLEELESYAPTIPAKEFLLNLRKNYDFARRKQTSSNK
jgi:hypothetical protein